MAALAGLGAVSGLAAAVTAFVRWLFNHRRDVDDAGNGTCSDDGDPPLGDLGSFLGGGGI